MATKQLDFIAFTPVYILIREYYLKHPEVAQEYAKLKQELAAKYSDDRKTYGAGKDAFIKSVIVKAKKEQVYLSYLMGADNIQDAELTGSGVEIKERKSDGDRTLAIPSEKLSQYIELMKAKLTNGFWNEVVGAYEIIFIFKFKDGHAEQRTLSPESEVEIAKLCSDFNGDPLEKTANVYEYISDNKFYHDFMMEHYADMINRK